MQTQTRFSLLQFFFKVCHIILMSNIFSTCAMTTVLVAHGSRLIYYSCMSAPWQVQKTALPTLSSYTHG